MRLYHSYRPASESTQRFSGALQSWFPEIHRKTFPGISEAVSPLLAAQRMQDIV